MKLLVFLALLFPSFREFFIGKFLPINTFCSEIQTKTQKHLDTLRRTLTLVHMYGTHLRWPYSSIQCISFRHLKIQHLSYSHASVVPRTCDMFYVQKE